MPFSFKAPEGQPAPSAFSAESLGARIKETKGGIFSFISYVIFGTTLLVAGGLFAYQYKLTSEVNEMMTTLSSQEGKMGAMPFDEMRKLSNRIKVVGQIISAHASVNSAFRILEETIENQSLYSRFDLRLNSGKGRYELALSARAPDYRSVVQQLDTFRSKTSSKYVQSFELVNLNPDDKGRITFTMRASLLIGGILFPELISFDPATTQVAPQVVAPQSVDTIPGTKTSTSTQ